MDVGFIGTGQMGGANARCLLQALAAAAARIVPMPVASLIRDHPVEAVARGIGDVDLSGLGRLAARMANVEPVTHARMREERKIWLSFLHGYSHSSGSHRRWR